MSDPNPLTDRGVPAGNDQHRRLLARVRRLAKWLDTAVAVPGTRIRFGLDAVIGLVPVAGDLFSAAISSWLIWSSAKAGAPPALLLRMLRNVVLDALAGLVPVLGDLLDLAFRSNVMNMKLVEGWLVEETREAPSRRSSVWLLSLLALAILLLFVVLAIAAARLLDLLILGNAG